MNRHELIKVLRQELGRDARNFNFVSGSDSKAIFRYEMHTLPSEVQQSIGTSTLFAAWNASIYVNQIEDERLEPVITSATATICNRRRKMLKKHRGPVVQRRKLRRFSQAIAASAARSLQEPDETHAVERRVEKGNHRVPARLLDRSHVARRGQARLVQRGRSAGHVRLRRASAWHSVAGHRPARRTHSGARLASGSTHRRSRKLESRAQLEQALAGLRRAQRGSRARDRGRSGDREARRSTAVSRCSRPVCSASTVSVPSVLPVIRKAARPSAQSARRARCSAKPQYARASGLNLYFATQFGFDPDAVLRWEAETTAAGVTLPIHVGMPGPASLRQFVKFAMVCGIGSSARMLTIANRCHGESAAHAGAGRADHRAREAPSGESVVANRQASLLLLLVDFSRLRGG